MPIGAPKSVLAAPDRCRYPFSMRAIRLSVTPARYVLARSLGRVHDAALYGTPSALELVDIDPPTLPGPRWVRLEVTKAGICGSDLNTLAFAASPSLEPFGSFPAVLGHEILARVAEVGSQVRGLEVDQRVVVDPTISCEVRGRPAGAWCRSCQAGLPGTCGLSGEEGPETVGEEIMAPGVMIGYHRSLPGGWSEQIVAHEEQLYPVDDALQDHAAVLIEPLAVGVHAALGSPPAEGEPVLVIGSGPIALGTVWALRATGFQGEILAQTKRAHEAKLAERLGASEAIQPGEAARDALVRTGARAYMPIVGPEVYAGGGFPHVFDCVGSRASLSQALRFAAPRGRIVVLGNSAISRLDLSSVWFRELDVKGYVGYGSERFRGRDEHTFEVTHELLLETGAPVDQMVTHVYPLGQYKDALRIATHRSRSEAVKVLLDPRN